ncbi:unnamed protein product [Arabidopsis halleri]
MRIYVRQRITSNKRYSDFMSIHRSSSILLLIYPERRKMAKNSY